MSVSEASRPRWIGLAGPTASGKTGIALDLAEHFPLEVISVDSALVFRGMDIGTAKPDPAQQARVPHHLIDLLDPAQAYSAARFVEDANRAIDEVQSRGKLPLLVGGTMLYFKALIDGLDALPAASPDVRKQIDAEAAALGWPEMHRQLSEVDPVTAARLAPLDAQRIQRALEVWRLTGQPLASFHHRSDQPVASVDHCLLALEPDSRPWLHQRIALRFEQMLAQGFLDEVTQLRQRAELSPDLPSIRCVGYRQAWEALDQGLTGEALQADLMARGVAATRQLAKRQLTWLRSMDRTSLPADAADIHAQTRQAVARHWSA
ncbi:tRNA (adenosine(37)-N6)-dimethylallyltransferase MiaA [Ideonella sp.]|uniref:tRNA (adenosine(37)-N6)-dimethylallyltransferase MiaA n=1 Tax=Ideonella sp. TaxID=1929293 RepID=UPI003BB72E3D